MGSLVQLFKTTGEKYKLSNYKETDIYKKFIRKKLGRQYLHEIVSRLRKFQTVFMHDDDSILLIMNICGISSVHLMKSYFHTD